MNFIKKYFGPSTLVTAAFIGPGTITICTLSGASFGYSLLWVLVFATCATIILQEMTARLGLVTQKGLGEAIRSQITNKILRLVSIVLVFTTIIIGNAAYEGGNISGAVLGLQSILGDNVEWSIVIGIIAFFILFIGEFKIIEKALIFLVILMSTVFLLTAIIALPNFMQVLKGLFVPSITAANQFTILALIGTTIVPYNLFLHAASVQQKWKSSSQLKELRKENAVTIGLGGMVSISIVITAGATLYGQKISGINDMANQLYPLMGNWGTLLMGIGLFAAGISSAITAPLAAAYTAKGIFGWDTIKVKSFRFRAIWMFVLLAGIIFSLTQYTPIEIIKIAQIANAILLPIVTFFLIYICNKKSLLNKYINKPWQNALSILVILVCLTISFKSFNAIFNFI